MFYQIQGGQEILIHTIFIFIEELVLELGNVRIYTPSSVSASQLNMAEVFLFSTYQVSELWQN